MPECQTTHLSHPWHRLARLRTHRLLSAWRQIQSHQRSTSRIQASTQGLILCVQQVGGGKSQGHKHVQLLQLSSQRQKAQYSLWPWGFTRALCCCDVLVFDECANWGTNSCVGGRFGGQHVFCRCCCLLQTHNRINCVSGHFRRRHIQ